MHTNEMNFSAGKAVKLIAAATLILATGSALAGPRYDQRNDQGRFKDTARVVSSTPIYEEYNNPRQECWTEQVGYRQEDGRDRSYAGAIIGGIAGGILGNQVGKGSGKSVATAVGAATGAIVGDNIDNTGDTRTARRSPQHEERCRTVDNWSRRIAGYDVTYRYQGREYTTVLPYEPGPTLRVKVRVEVDDQY